MESDSDVEFLGVASSEDSEVEFLEELGLDRSSLGPLAKGLGVDFKVAPVETLSYCLLCKHNRGEVIQKSDILEVWDVLPSKFKHRDKETEGASMTVFGANPRNTKSLSVATVDLPHTFELLRAFIEQQCPEFKFSCVCLRLNGLRGPHRDTRNIDNNMVLSLTTHQRGGALWVADSAGSVTMFHQGRAVQGRLQDISEPFIFPARTVLHDTQPWFEPKRVVLVAFTPIGTLTLQNSFNPHKGIQKRIQDYFPTRTTTV